MSPGSDGRMPRDSTRVVERPAEIVREYGPFPEHVRGVTYDGKDVWFAAGESVESFDPETGASKRSLKVRADAGTAFDGRHLFQLFDQQIQKIDLETGRVLASLPAPGKGRHAGLTWAEGSLWIAEFGEPRIYQVDPETGRVLRIVPSTRYVTGVTWVDGDLWHGHWENEQSDIRRIDLDSGETLERLVMPEGIFVTGLESNGSDLFYCGGGSSRKVRAVRRPKKR